MKISRIFNRFLKLFRQRPDDLDRSKASRICDFPAVWWSRSDHPRRSGKGYRCGTSNLYLEIDKRYGAWVAAQGGRAISPEEERHRRLVIETGFFREIFGEDSLSGKLEKRLLETSDMSGDQAPTLVSNTHAPLSKWERRNTEQP